MKSDVNAPCYYSAMTFMVIEMVSSKCKYGEEISKKYLIALPCFPNSKGYCHPTILVKAKNEAEAIALVRHLKGNSVDIGEIKEVSY
jgi:hypothetical protein